MIGTKTELCVSGENSWKFNFRWKLPRTLIDGLAPFWPTGSAPRFISLPMPAKAIAFSLMNSWQTCSLWAMLRCLLFSWGQGYEMCKNPVLWCSSHFMGKEMAFTESAGGEMEAQMEPSRKVWEGSNEINENIVIPVSVQNICIGFRDPDNWTGNAWSQPPWTSLMLQLKSSVYCSILGKTSQLRKIKLTRGSSSLFIKEYTFYLPLLRHFILCPLVQMGTEH